MEEVIVSVGHPRLQNWGIVPQIFRGSDKAWKNHISGKAEIRWFWQIELNCGLKRFGVDRVSRESDDPRI